MLLCSSGKAETFLDDGYPSFYEVLWRVILNFPRFSLTTELTISVLATPIILQGGSSKFPSLTWSTNSIAENQAEKLYLEINCV